MTLASLQAAIGKVEPRVTRELDARDQHVRAEALEAYRRAARSPGVANWDDGTKRTIRDVVVRSTSEAVKNFQSAARVDIADELGAISDEARRVGQKAYVAGVETHRLESLADGFLDRISTRVGAAKDKPASLLAEAYQVDRIVLTESFRAYNLTRTATMAWLRDRGAGDTYRVPTSFEGQRSISDWVVGIVKVWNATLDRQTCPICESLDGKLRPFGAAFDGHADPPEHANCRCYVGFWPVAVPIH